MKDFSEVDYSGGNEVGIDHNPAPERQEKPFVRDDSDNKIFSDVQVKDIRDIITEDCIGHYDFDTVVYKACTNMENKFVTVTHKTEGWSEDFANKSTFKGLGKGVTDKSWLGLKNTERSMESKPLWSLDDFEIKDCHTLKMDKDKAIEQVKIQLFLKLKQVRQQYRVPKIKPHIGGGLCFRHDLDLCREYKGNRQDSLRPILLSEVRKWVETEMESEIARAGFEADDRVEHYGATGYLHYLKTGKFNHLVISADKDSKNNPKLLIDPDTYVGENNPLKGKYKFPQAMLLLDSNKDCGNIEIVQKTNAVDFKFRNFKGLLWQAFLSGDSADHYNCLSHLGQKLSFGDESAYKLLKSCTTSKEALQAVIDKFAELLPYGVQYTSHKGEDLDVDTITYMNTYFRVAYMTRTYEDAMDFYKLCAAFKVDTSAIVENNKLTPPQRVYVGNQEHLTEVSVLIDSILKEDMKGFKTLKKADSATRIDIIKEKLAGINFESHYEMQQFEKEGV